MEKMANEWENEERNLEATINELAVAESDMAAESKASVFKLDASSVMRQSTRWRQPSVKRQ